MLSGDLGAMPGVELDMNRLGNPELAADDLVTGLNPLVTGYRAWLAEQPARIDSVDDAEIGDYAPAAHHAVTEAERIADRLERAVELLRVDGQAREAFRFANQAMARQRVRGELVRRRTADPRPTEVWVIRSRRSPAAGSPGRRATGPLAHRCTPSCS